MQNSPRLAPLLLQLQHRLEELDAPVVPHLQPGADRQHIAAVLMQRGITSTGELLDWWGWHDGTDAATPYGAAFVPSPETLLLADWHLPTLDQAVASYDRLHRTWEGELPRTWWPVLRMSVPAVRCAETAGGGQLFLVDGHADLPADPPQPLAASLTDFVTLLLDLFDAGAVIPGSPVSGGLAVDQRRFPDGLPFPNYW